MPAHAITTPQFLHLEVKATPERPAVHIRAVHDAHRGVYVTASLSLDHPVVAITPTLLGKMRLGTIRKDALRAALADANVHLSEKAPIKTYFKGGNGRPVAERFRLSPTPEHLDTAATIHQLAKLVGDFPVLAVARSFNLSPSDARRWLALARRSASAE